jgi:hypothetical protein
LSLAIPTTRARGPAGLTVSITFDKAFADASVWAGRCSEHQQMEKNTTEKPLMVNNSI